MKRFVSDIDRIMALIYEDQPLPPPVPKEAAPFPAPGFPVRKNRLPAERRVREVPAAPRPQLQLDLASLAKIRSDAEITRNKLITDEELKEMPMPEEAEPLSVLPVLEAEDPEPAAEERTPFPCGLDAVETKVLLALLKGEDVRTVSTGGRLLSVLIDEINEKLFDEFADTVLENAPSPKALSDYEEELKAMFLG